MKTKRQARVEEESVIQSAALPSRCPKCGSAEIAVSRPHASGDQIVTRVTCGGAYGPCGWTGRYALGRSA